MIIQLKETFITTEKNFKKLKILYMFLLKILSEKNPKAVQCVVAWLNNLKGW